LWDQDTENGVPMRPVGVGTTQQVLQGIAVILVMLSPILFFVALHWFVDRVRRWRRISSANRYTVLDWEDMCGEVFHKPQAEQPSKPSLITRLRRRRPV